jgi:hypothetical protein
MPWGPEGPRGPGPPTTPSLLKPNSEGERGAFMGHSHWTETKTWLGKSLATDIGNVDCGIT